MRSSTPVLIKLVCLGLLASSYVAVPVRAADHAAPLTEPGRAWSASQPELAQPAKRADFKKANASAQARHVADWVLDSRDNQGLPFVIVDKKNANVFVFHANGRLRGAAPALLGLALGDDSVPGIGERKLSSIQPEERTTPAGRFVAALDHNLQGKQILWVDYDGAISLHPVITSNAQEFRAQRLATPTPLDNRISYGCINVPAEFFKRVVSPAFSGSNGIVYVLPETRSVQQVFSSYDVKKRTRQKAASQPATAPIEAEILLQPRPAVPPPKHQPQ